MNKQEVRSIICVIIAIILIITLIAYGSNQADIAQQELRKCVIDNNQTDCIDCCDDIDGFLKAFPPKYCLEVYS